MNSRHKIIRLLLCLLMWNISQIVSAQTIRAKTGTLPIGGADGVALWIHPSDPSKSMVIGADPGKGLGTFSLDGRLIQVVNFGVGGAGEVDVRAIFPLGDKTTTIIASANNKKNTLRLFTVDPVTRLLQEVTGKKASLKINAYGSCLYHSHKTGKFYVFVTSREGGIEQWEIFDNGQAKVDAKLVREINIMPEPKEGITPKTEACVADDELGWVYFAQEKECNIWRYGAEPTDGDTRKLVDNAKIKDGDNVEGLAIYHDGPQNGYLIASIQGSWKYKIYTRGETNAPIGTFDVMTADGSGLIESHDCIEVTHLPLGPDYPHGLMVTQNANNACGSHFQLIPWQSIAKLFNLKL